MFNIDKSCMNFSHSLSIVFRETLQSGDTHRTCHLTFLVGALLDYCGKHSLYETELFEKSLQLLCKLFCCSRTEISSTAFVALEKLTAKHKSVLESNRYVQLVHKFLNSVVVQDIQKLDRDSKKRL